MGQKKLIRFEAIKGYENVFEYPVNAKGTWNEFFKNNNGIQNIIVNRINLKYVLFDGRQIIVCWFYHYFKHRDTYKCIHERQPGKDTGFSKSQNPEPIKRKRKDVFKSTRHKGSIRTVIYKYFSRFTHWLTFALWDKKS